VEIKEGREEMSTWQKYGLLAITGGLGLIGMCLLKNVGALAGLGLGIFIGGIIIIVVEAFSPTGN